MPEPVLHAPKETGVPGMAVGVHVCGGGDGEGGGGVGGGGGGGGLGGEGAQHLVADPPVSTSK